MGYAALTYPAFDPAYPLITLVLQGLWPIISKIPEVLTRQGFQPSLTRWQTSTLSSIGSLLIGKGLNYVKFWAFIRK